MVGGFIIVAVSIFTGTHFMYHLYWEEETERYPSVQQPARTHCIRLNRYLVKVVTMGA
jgi:hypothetical protein